MSEWGAGLVMSRKWKRRGVERGRRRREYVEAGGSCHPEWQKYFHLAVKAHSNP